jgi:hypothetical protein
MFRIVTERKDVDSIKETLWAYALDFTLVLGEGSWRGQPEQSLIIELNDVSRDVAQRAAHAIKDLNRQENVLLQEIDIRSELI